MKMAFKGFRGFGKDADFIELKDLTILTGKNSSGKSTFIKLLQLFGNSLKGINSLYDLTKIEINIANDIFGGKENLESLQKVAETKWIFSIPFEFYIDYQEIHVCFKILDYIIKVETIEIYDVHSLKTKTPFITVNSELTVLNVKYLLEKYKYAARLTNALEDFKTKFPDKTKITNSSLEQLKNQLRSIGIKKGELQYYIDMKIYNFYDDYDTEIGLLNRKMITEKDLEIEWQVPEFIFKTDNSKENYSFYINPATNYNLKIKRKDIAKIICDSEWYEYIEEHIAKIKTYNPNFDFEKLLIEWYNFELENFILNTNDLSFTDRYEIFDYLAKIESKQNKKIIEKWYKNEYIESINELPGLIDFRCKELMKHKYELTYPLAKVSFNIFQKYIIQFFKSLHNANFLSNVRTIPERSFNIYNPSNIFSSFIKYWKTLNEKERNQNLKFLRKYLQLFEIADDINIKIESNIGFIQLLKKGSLISIIDEGSGISNVLNCLLYFAQYTLPRGKSKNSYYLSQEYKQILVLEEPESNLHPCLQSLLADLLVDIVRKHNIQLIIETHSEYLIRKLQYLVAKKKVNPECISLNYFSLNYKANAPFISVKKIPISKDGRLEEEFGPGFLDEADNIAIQLFDIQKNRLN